MSGMTGGFAGYRPSVGGSMMYPSGGISRGFGGPGFGMMSPGYGFMGPSAYGSMSPVPGSMGTPFSGPTSMAPPSTGPYYSSGFGFPSTSGAGHTGMASGAGGMPSGFGYIFLSKQHSHSLESLVIKYFLNAI
jgi:hypothetical protein